MSLKHVNAKRGGIYLLRLHLAAAVAIGVGRLGTVHFPAGDYLYVGSAMGGLDARLARHFRAEKRLHWHIDYLRAVATVSGAYVLRETRAECEVAALVAAMPGAERAAGGFGASDCRCAGHLVRVPEGAVPGIAGLERYTGEG